MGTYDSAAALAKRLIEKKGGKTTLRQFRASTIADPDKPWDETAASPEKSDKMVKAVFLDFDFRGSEPYRYADGSLVQVGDKQVYIAATSLGSLEVGLGNQLLRADGSVWTVARAKLLDPDGQKILWEAWVKK